MTEVWPRLTLVESSRLFGDLKRGEAITPAASYVGQTYGPVGARVHPRDIERLQAEMRALADNFGYPTGSLVGDAGTEFDRAAGQILSGAMDVSWSEAAQREVWSFMALVVLPDITEYRWKHRLPERNEERWIGRDLTRHTWARLWWRVTAFGSRTDLLDRLNESELNQLVERRSIGGHPRLLAAVTEAFLAAVDDGAPRRALVRDVGKRIVRRVPFLDDLAMTDDTLRALSQQLVEEARSALEV